MKNKTIGVFFGGQSPEHDISIITGQLIISGLTGAGYNVLPVYVSKKGKWYANEMLNNMEFFAQDDFDAQLEKISATALLPDGSHDSMVSKEDTFRAKKRSIDIAFPAFHGANGEDGTMQGIFELANIPYVGCDVTSSALTMDKILTKQFYKGNNIPTTDFVSIKKHNWKKDQKKCIQKIVEKLTFPLIIKPSRLGSSIGISKAKNEKDLIFAIDVALHYDTAAIVETCIQNLMDVTCAVMGNETPRASLLQETVFSDDVFSYDEKYLNDGGAQTGKAQNNLVIPARLDDTTTEKIQNLSKEIFTLFGCSGIARVDFLYDKDTKEVYANEVNTLPGTLYHHLWKKSGVSLEELLEELLQLAQEKHKQKKELTTTFESSVLKNANALKLQK